MNTQTGATNGRVASGEAAEVVTATVEIAMVRIGRKQMTLSVFRQLPLAPVIDPNTAELRGTPWGIVNYYPEERDPQYARYIPVLWAANGRLYRSKTYPDPNQAEGLPGLNALGDVADKRLNTYVRACVAYGHNPFAAGEFQDTADPTVSTIELAGRRWPNTKADYETRRLLRGQPIEVPYQVRRDHGNPKEGTPEDTALAEWFIEETRRLEREKLRESGLDFDQARQQLFDAINAEDEWRAKYAASVDACYQAGQLFIAL